jgi:hypothetical protein
MVVHLHIERRRGFPRGVAGPSRTPQCAHTATPTVEMNIVRYVSSLPQLWQTTVTLCMGTSPGCLRCRFLAPSRASGAGHAVVRWREAWDESPGETRADAAFEGRRHRLYGPEPSGTRTKDAACRRDAHQRLRLRLTDRRSLWRFCRPYTDSSASPSLPLVRPRLPNRLRPEEGSRGGESPVVSCGTCMPTWKGARNERRFRVGPVQGLRGARGRRSVPVLHPRCA